MQNKTGGANKYRANLLRRCAWNSLRLNAEAEAEAEAKLAVLLGMVRRGNYALAASKIQDKEVQDLVLDLNDISTNFGDEVCEYVVKELKDKAVYKILENFFNQEDEQYFRSYYDMISNKQLSFLVSHTIKKKNSGFLDYIFDHMDGGDWCDLTKEVQIMAYPYNVEKQAFEKRFKELKSKYGDDEKFSEKLLKARVAQEFLDGGHYII